jgi:type I restriction enzyme M protein
MADPNLSSFIWSVADLLRGDYKQSEYGKVILPFTVLRRLDCVLEKTKAAVLAEDAKRKQTKVNPEPFLLKKSGQLFFNNSPLDMKKLMGDQDHIKENLYAYIQAFSPAVRDIFEAFEFHTQIDRLAKAGLLYLVSEKFATIDLHPETVSNAQMGVVFEELIRKFAEISNETAGEHFTPREVIRLMMNLLFIEDDEALTKPGVVRSLYDPTAGTGGMLSVGGEHIAELNPDARLVMYGQELNPESYAICKADMLIKGQDIANIIQGNTLSEDGLPDKKFDYMASNPPFGVEWKKIEKEVRKEAEHMGYSGRFGPGLPRVSDGSLLFLLHLISKMAPVKDGGSKFGIVLNGSPLFTGGAGSGESEIRRYVLENALSAGHGHVRPALPGPVADFRLRQHGYREAGDLLQAPPPAARLRPGARRGRPVQDRPHPPHAQESGQAQPVPERRREPKTGTAGRSGRREPTRKAESPPERDRPAGERSLRGRPDRRRPARLRE